MSETSTGTPTPTGRSRWLVGALIASLAVNLLFVGGGLARYFYHPPMERMSGLSQMQLIPRRFMGELGEDRRKELLQVFRSYGPGFRDGRKESRAAVLKLAETLDAEPYDAAKVKAAIADFAASNERLIARGGDAALDVISRLTPEERKQLARHIRLRDSGGKPPEAERD